ncbi:MAG TPA: hypothetical protein VGD72_07515 [Mycobacteriales bacterium]|jgi:hypothetical protein
MTTGDNEGIVVFGGSVRAGNLAVGRGARISGDGSAGAGQEAADRLAEFREELRRHADAVPDPAELRAATTALEEQLGAPERDPGTIRRLLTGITDAVTTVTPLATAAAALESAVRALL